MQAEAGALAAPGMTERDPEPRDSEETRDLVRLATAGDAAAFEALMLRHQRQVLGTALRLLGNSEDARDAAQEVFLRLFKHLRRLDPARSVGAWLYRVTVNACHDIGRKRSRRAGAPIELQSAEQDAAWAASENTEDRIAVRQQWQLLQSALGRLPEKERAAIVLRDVEGLETHEVARILGTSEVTVRTHVSRARVRLRMHLERMLGRKRT